jgi:hypothetical protein
VIGASNSALTQSLAIELSKCGADRIPVLLMTDATADSLVSINHGRSFRFGYNNSYQAKAVVARLKEYYASKGFGDANVHALVIQVVDDPFAVDLAYHFERELADQLSAAIVPPAKPSGVNPPILLGPPPANAWSLSTSTGAFDSPSEEEWALAHMLVEEMAQAPEAPWAVALPVGTTPYRRMSYALHRALDDYSDRAKTAAIRQRITILSGDSMSYATFAQSQRSQLYPEESPAPVIFFAHVNPLEGAVDAESRSQASAQLLNRDVVHVLLDVVSELGSDPTAEALATALARYSPDDRPSFFVNGERREGGGAILAIPRPRDGDFQLVVPTAWRPSG